MVRPVPTRSSLKVGFFSRKAALSCSASNLVSMVAGLPTIGDLSKWEKLGKPSFIAELLKQRRDSDAAGGTQVESVVLPGTKVDGDVLQVGHCYGRQNDKITYTHDLCRVKHERTSQKPFHVEVGLRCVYFVHPEPTSVPCQTCAWLTWSCVIPWPLSPFIFGLAVMCKILRGSLLSHVLYANSKQTSVDTLRNLTLTLKWQTYIFNGVISTLNLHVQFTIKSPIKVMRTDLLEKERGVNELYRNTLAKAIMRGDGTFLVVWAGELLRCTPLQWFWWHQAWVSTKIKIRKACENCPVIGQHFLRPHPTVLLEAMLFFLWTKCEWSAPWLLIGWWCLVVAVSPVWRSYKHILRSLVFPSRHKHPFYLNIRKPCSYQTQLTLFQEKMLSALLHRLTSPINGAKKMSVPTYSEV